MNKINFPDNIFYYYIIIYLIFLIFGYSLLSDIINNKTIKIINFDNNTPNFILKRILQLSLITLLFSSITFLSLNINLYIISFILNIVVIIGYWLYFAKNNLLTYFIHIIMAIPIFILPFYISFNGVINYDYILILIIFLLFYKLYLFNYVYNISPQSIA
jgi:hypothetical protein